MGSLLAACAISMSVLILYSPSAPEIKRAHQTVCAQTVGKSGAAAPAVLHVVLHFRQSYSRFIIPRSAVSRQEIFSPDLSFSLNTPCIVSWRTGMRSPFFILPDYRVFPALFHPFLSDIICCIIPDTKSYPQLPQSFPQATVFLISNVFRNINHFSQTRKRSFSLF